MVSLLHQCAPTEHVNEIRVFHGTSASALSEGSYNEGYQFVEGGSHTLCFLR